MQKVRNGVTAVITGAAALLSSVPAVLAQSISAPTVTQVSGGNIVNIIKTVGGWMLGIAGALAVVYLIYGGIMYIVGGAKGAETAKGIIINAIIGLVIIVLSYVIANLVITTLNG